MGILTARNSHLLKDNWLHLENMCCLRDRLGFLPILCGISQLVVWAFLFFFYRTFVIVWESSNKYEVEVSVWAFWTMKSEPSCSVNNPALRWEA